MSQPQTLTSLADVPMSASAQQQFQQYLSRVPASPSTARASGLGSRQNAPSDLDALLIRGSHLTSRVDALHSQLSNAESSSSSRTDDPQLFWTTLTLLTNLRELSSQLQRTFSDRKANDALARTQQNVNIIESLLRLLSVSNSENASDTFTAPVRSQQSFAAPTTSPTSASSGTGESKGYEYWKQQTLSALDDDNLSAHSTTTPDLEEDDQGAVSDTESVLTDPEIHLGTSSSTPLAGIKPPAITDEDEEELSAYDRAKSPASPPPTNTTHPPSTTTTTTPNASDTILQSDRATHEALSTELLRMASILKSNSLAFADSLERDRLLLEKAAHDLGQNLDLMTRTRGRLGMYSKKARSMGWFTLSAILVVIVSWMLMFLLIRLT